MSIGGNSLATPLAPRPSGVAPVQGLEARIGIAAPTAVAQPQAVQQLAESVLCTSETRFPAHRPRCHMCASGSASGASKTDSNHGFPLEDPQALAQAGRRLVSGAISGRMPSGPGPSATSSPAARQTRATRTDPNAPPRSQCVSSPPLIPALPPLAHGVQARRSAIRSCRTAAPGHRTRSRSPRARPHGSSSSRAPSPAPPRPGRHACSPCTRGRASGRRPTPNYCLPPRPRSFRRFWRRLR